MDIEIDEIDRKIIELLQADPRCTNKKLASEAATSESTIAARLKKLIASKVLRITIEEDISQHGYRLYVLATIKTPTGERDEVAKKLAKIKDIQVVLTILAGSEVLALFFARDQSQVNEISDQIAVVSGVNQISLDISSKIYKYSSAYGLLDSESI